MKYEGAEKAVELCEHLKHWDMYRGVAVTESLTAMKEKMRGSLVEAMNKTLDPEKKKVLSEALDQWDHPNFFQYLVRKVTST
jgi:hypothetical protein